jgi:hypothetical protein
MTPSSLRSALTILKPSSFRASHGALIAGAALLIAGYSVGVASAEGIPLQNPLAYSGQLTDVDGLPSDGNFEIEILLYDDETARDRDALLCSTLAKDVEVEGGFFSVNLHQDCLAAVTEESNTWLELRVDGERLTRSKVGAVPYAVNAQNAVSAKDADFAESAESAEKAVDAEQAEYADSATPDGTLDQRLSAMEGGSLDWLSVESAAYNVPAADATLGQAICPEGYVVTGGGHLSPTNYFRTRRNYPVDERTWEVMLFNTHSEPKTFTVFATCLRKGLFSAE